MELIANGKQALDKLEQSFSMIGLKIRLHNALAQIKNKELNVHGGVDLTLELYKVHEPNKRAFILNVMTVLPNGQKTNADKIYQFEFPLSYSGLCGSFKEVTK